jgi:hypothetical protein
VVLERLPPGLDRVERGVEHDAVRVQVRIQGARGVVSKHGGDDVSRGPVRALAILSDASGREGLQLIQCRRDRLFVRLDNARVMSHQRGNGH